MSGAKVQVFVDACSLLWRRCCVGLCGLGVLAASSPATAAALHRLGRAEFAAALTGADLAFDEDAYRVDHPRIESFCPDGRYLASVRGLVVTGAYRFQDGVVCYRASGPGHGELCRAIYADRRGGYGWAWSRSLSDRAPDAPPSRLSGRLRVEPGRTLARACSLASPQ